MSEANETEAQPPAASPQTSAPKPLEGHKPVEEWARIKGTAPMWFNAAKMLGGWGIGRELDEKAYDAAIEAVQKVEMR